MGVVGHCNPYETIEYFLKKKVWEWQMDERGKANCRYGNLHEPVAEEAFAAYTATFIDMPDERGGRCATSASKNLACTSARPPATPCSG